MKNDIGIRHKAHAYLLGLVLLAAPGLAAQAALTDLANTPLVNAAGLVVRPNMMFVLDNSGSMDFNYMPDYVGYDNGSASDPDNMCRSDGSQSRGVNDNDRACDGTRDDGGALTQGGEPPVFSYFFNSIYYNPNIRYQPPVNPCNTAQNLPSMNEPTKVRVRGHQIDSSCVQTSSVVDLANNFPERVYCTSYYGYDCKRNGIDEGIFSGDYDYPQGSYDYARTISSHPHYYLITPTEHCDSSMLQNCTDSPLPTGKFSVPAYVRFCNSVGAARSAPGSSSANGNNNNSECQAKYSSIFKIARYGNFKRVDIVPSVNNYPKSADRSDCTGNTCTYDEEVANFSNWYAYYRTRMQTMKSSAGQAFSSIDDAYRVGFLTINPGNPINGSQYLAIDDFNSTQKANWYKKFYDINPNGGTPLRQALSRVGRHYANITSGINDGMAEDPIEYECQQNFALLTTDGYWNGAEGIKINGSSIGNQDNVNSGYSTRALGAFDGNLSGSSDTLADVAMYYYKTDLRTGMPNQVPTDDKDTASHQHMVTFTLGLGLDGERDYRPDYETATSGDFASIKAGQLNWPPPLPDRASALDDLWHAAVNGRGTYFSAKNPNSLTSGIQGTLNRVTVKTGAAAASATSSPNITPSDNFIYSSTYTTSFWYGTVEAKTLDTQTGEVSDSFTWSTKENDSRNIGKVFKMNMPAPAANPNIETFTWDNLNTTEQEYFSNLCEESKQLLSQCSTLSSTAKLIANDGSAVVNFLVGDRSNEGEITSTDRAFRSRKYLLGDTVNATPAFVQAPRFNFADDGYNQFKSDNAERQGMLYIAANDGMLHALNASTGVEQWAYVPNIVLKDMYNLADKNYGSKHRFLVDGTPQVMDIKDGSTWKTILVGGLNGGGRGYYALDITNPASPQPLWEFCYDSAYCNVTDADLGFSYGNPVIAKMPTGSAQAGKWVVMVTSGYNNVSPGDGEGHLYVLDAVTGAVLQKISTDVGNTENPSGLAKISAWADNGNIDATATHVYGGDLLGNVWRFNLQTASVSASKLATLAFGGVAQPVTTKPELGKIKGINDRIVYVGTGKYLGASDISNTATQSIYAIRDSGTTVDGRSLTPRTIAQSGVTASVSGDAVDWANGGWYADLPESKERVNIDPQLVLGTLLVATSTPIGNTCSPGGTSWIYQFDFATGLNVIGATSILGNKQTSGLVVGIVVFRLPNGQLKGVATTGDGTQDTFGVHTNPTVSGAKRTGWRELTR